MSTRDQKLIDSFTEELAHNIQLMENSLIELKEDSSDFDEKVIAVLKIIHSLKGTSRLLSFKNLEKIFHAQENIIKGIRDKKYAVTRILIQLNFQIFDFLRKIAIQIRSGGDDDFIFTEAILSVSERVSAGEPYSLSELKEKLVQEKNGSVITEINETGSSDFLKIKLSELEKLIRLSGSVSMRQLNLKRVARSVYEIEEKMERILQIQSAENKTLNFLQKETLEQVRGMKLSFMQSFSELENGVRDLNDNIITLRMVPLNSILDSFHRMVEDISFEINKEAKLTVKGGHIKVDKYILDKIYDPLIHLVRNSLDHGIETPEERRESEKSNNGNIIIDCKIEGSHVVIRVSDDGRGLNKDNILFKILENNLADMLEIQNLSENDILSYIFQPGFTTKERVTSISGRGIGLSVVKENIEAIKGKITIENSPGQGLSFVCTFPVSLANVEGFFIYSGGRKFLIPARFVKETIIAKEDQISSITNSDIYNLRGKAIPVYNLNSIIEAKDTEGGNEKVISILVVNDSIGETTGIIINSVLSYGSIVYKALPKNLSTLELIQGVVFDENYDIIPILFIPKVIEKLKGLSRFEVKKKNISTKKTAKTVLIVEDSPNSREILQRIFSLQGYNVFGASDGIDALEIIRKRRPDIILTDIEMPRMDGKTLITNLRKDDSTKNIPVIIISNTVDRIKDTSEMRQLSITGFVAKSRFDEASLVELVNLAIG